jgi:hypothetical protein
MPELMINAGWTDKETMDRYLPRFLHALNLLSDCKLDNPVTASEVVIMMDKPAGFNPDGYKTIRDNAADTLLSQMVSRLQGKNYLAKVGDSLYATKDGLEKRRATDSYWKRSPKEVYDCDEDKPN